MATFVLVSSLLYTAILTLSRISVLIGFIPGSAFDTLLLAVLAHPSIVFAAVICIVTVTRTSRSLLILLLRILALVLSHLSGYTS